jgi:hypothetical protein
VYLALELWLINALAAGTHITFPVMAAPLVLLWAGARRDDVLRLLAATGAVVLGWFTSPYALRWVDVFALNFGYDAVLSGPAPPGELSPGFAVAPLLGIALAALPFVVDARSMRRMERVALALLWLAGLVLFSRYFKGLGPWWWCALPLVAVATQRLPEPSDQRIDRGWALLTPLALLACATTNIQLWSLTHVYEGGMDTRSLPSLKAFATEPAAQWLELNTTIPNGTRLLTTTNYGSYLKWRLPAVSESVDSRSVFPDSVLLPDVPTTAVERSLGPWESSDLAVVPETYPVARVLDQRPEWRRIGTASPAPWALAAPRAGLWARRTWLASHVRTPLPNSSQPLELTADRRPR